MSEPIGNQGGMRQGEPTREVPLDPSESGWTKIDTIRKLAEDALLRSKAAEKVNNG